jgi:hypothetical protein
VLYEGGHTLFLPAYLFEELGREKMKTKTNDSNHNHFLWPHMELGEKSTLPLAFTIPHHLQLNLIPHMDSSFQLRFPSLKHTTQFHSLLFLKFCYIWALTSSISLQSIPTAPKPT